MATDSRPTRIPASKYIHDDDAVIDSAMRVAVDVVDAIQAGRSVEVDVTDVRGIPSSFFNVIFRHIVDHVGKAGLHRVTFDTTSSLQRSIMQRSFDAFLAEGEPGADGKGESAA
jgi:hypothetical protein